MDPRPGEPDSELLRIAAHLSDREAIAWDTEIERSPAESRAIALLRSLEALARVYDEAPQAAIPPGLASGAIAATTAATPDAAEGAEAGEPRETPAAWGPLRILEELGRGGFGSVYRAWDPQLEREVALKLWRPGRAHDTAALLAEARALARLRHPNLPAVHGVDEHNGRPGMWTELVRGRTLEQLLAAHGPFGAREAARAGLETCRALGAVHAAGLVHRDVKTSNVMREEGGRVVLVDFGLAFDSSAGGLAGRGAGTPPSMAPELLRGERATVRSDVYALGVLIYRLATRAFPRGDAAAGDTRMTPLRGRRPDLSGTFARLVERALAESPADRYASAAEFERALEEFLGAAAPDTRSTTVATAEQTASDPLRRPLTGFIGRDQELWECRERLRSARLVTLVGPGGCGKTRLALRVAEQAASGAGVVTAFADLSPLAEGVAIESAILAAFGIPEGAPETAPRRLAEALAGHEALLVLDNCEAVIPALAARVPALMQSCPALRLLATSRKPLAVPGEWLLALGGLALPPEGSPLTADAVAEFDAVRLFVDRARQARPDFRLTDANAALVVDLCRRMDGLPLAIELAAARMRALTIEEVRDRLEAGLRLLARPGAKSSARHDTLAEAIRASWEALPGQERLAFEALAVFAGGWTLAAAARVALESADEFEVLDCLSDLIDHSLVTTDAPRLGVSRYRFLETIHRFAHERLAASGHREAAVRRHFDFFLELAESAERGLWSPEQATWAERLDADHANLLAALEGARLEPGREVDRLRMAGALARFWTERGHLAGGRRILSECLERVPPGVHDAARARALLGAGMLATYQSDHADAQRRCDEALALYRELGDPLGSARALTTLGVLGHDRADYAAARACYRDALALYRELGDRGGIARVLNNLGAIAWREGAWDEAHGLNEEALAHATEAGDPGSRVLALTNLGFVELNRGRHREAIAHLAAGLDAVAEHRLHRHAASTIEATAAVLARHAESARAARLYAAAARQRERVGLSSGGAWHAAHAPAREFVARDLGESRLEVERRAGRAMDLAAAVADARRGLELLGGAEA